MGHCAYHKCGVEAGKRQQKHVYELAFLRKRRGNVRHLVAGTCLTISRSDLRTQITNTSADSADQYLSWLLPNTHAHGRLVDAAYRGSPEAYPKRYRAHLKLGVNVDVRWGVRIDSDLDELLGQKLALGWSVELLLTNHPQHVGIARIETLRSGCILLCTCALMLFTTHTRKQHQRRENSGRQVGRLVSHRARGATLTLLQVQTVSHTLTSNPTESIELIPACMLASVMPGSE